MARAWGQQPQSPTLLCVAHTHTHTYLLLSFRFRFKMALQRLNFVLLHFLLQLLLVVFVALQLFVVQSLELPDFLLQLLCSERTANHTQIKCNEN